MEAFCHSQSHNEAHKFPTDSVVYQLETRDVRSGHLPSISSISPCPSTRQVAAQVRIYGFKSFRRWFTPCWIVSNAFISLFPFCLYPVFFFFFLMKCKMMSPVAARWQQTEDKLVCWAKRGGQRNGVRWVGLVRQVKGGAYNIGQLNWRDPRYTYMQFKNVCRSST